MALGTYHKARSFPAKASRSGLSKDNAGAIP